jgi:hypothetical protein
MRLFSRRLLAVFSLASLAVASISAPSPASAGPRKAEADRARIAGESDDAAAARLNDEGKALVRAGKYNEALQKFELALEFFPLSNAIFNVGSMHYTLKQYAEAFPYLEQTLKAPLAPEQLEIVRRYRSDVIEKLKDTHREVLIQTNPPGATVTVDGKEQPFVAPLRILVVFGTVDVKVEYVGFEAAQVVLQSTPTSPPKDQLVRLKREEPQASVTVRCPSGADVFIDGTMQGFDLVRTRLLAGDHTVRCNKTSKTGAFERQFIVRRGVPNNFDFSKEKE